jgi:hypothetical protein
LAAVLAGKATGPDIVVAQSLEFQCSDWWIRNNSGSASASVFGFAGQMSTGTTPGSTSRVWAPQVVGIPFNCYNDATNSLDWDKPWIISWRVRVTARSTGGQIWLAFGRFAYGVADLSQAGVGFRINDLTLTAQSYSASLTTTATLATLTAGTDNHLAIRNNADGTATCYLNGVSVGTLTGVPTGKSAATFFSFNAANNADASATAIQFGHVKFTTLQ